MCSSDLDAGPVIELVAVDPQAEARCGAGAQHPLGLGGVEGPLLAEHVDPLREAGGGGNDLLDHEVDVPVGVLGVLRRDDVGGEQALADVVDVLTTPWLA
mgnify:CR=1 FL=1